MSDIGPEQTSHDVRCLGVMRSKADVTTHTHCADGILRAGLNYQLH
jgi:hypothetical protein